ncbi:hypothetical protein NG54_03400 [Heyndrickxia ginsengihumi]|uniref:DUF3383 family protein n=1 Tax=Heyndrickxia ginsengihumi TaxID=363870 RepID=A0A0A6VIC1_9BACI|nr:DUF3383 family protein [Heyndrickxia ginsengihumi]KHD86374.1 hypothetical protein NG54_03400 [Heyndrickxia ginsengihumi]
MPLSDVTVTIDLVKPSGLVGLGKPLILAQKTGTSFIKNYSDITAVKEDFDESTNAYKKAAAIFAQSHRPKELSIATYDPGVTGTEGTEEGTEETGSAEPSGITTAAKAVEKYFWNDWFFALTADAEQADKIAVADYVEGQKFKLFVVKTQSESERKAFKDKKYEFVIDFYHPTADEEADAALVGECGSQTVGSITWKFKTLTGITPIDITSDELNAIHQDGAIAYVMKAGISQTSEGLVVSGEYIDVIHGKSWIKTNIETSVQTAFANNPKLSFDSRGISVLEGQVTTVLKQAFTNGIIAADSDGNPIYSITAKSRDDIPADERASRIYNGLSFSFDLAGAIHEATITGEIGD